MPDPKPKPNGTQVPLDREPVESVLARFDERKEILETFCTKTKSLIEECLQDANIRYQSVQARVKRRQKLKDKYLDETKNYTNLDDITDQVALRVITYYEDEVDRAADIIKREFVVSPEQSVDKRETEPDRFGYYALNFVCNHLDRRTSSVEYKKFAGISFEIQVTSILRHAWSEIEHEWYDLKDAYPDPIKRRFYRLAALLEIAESEFLDLRKSKASYRQSIAVQVEAGVPDLALDAVSIASLLREAIPKEVDERLADLMGYEIFEPSDRVLEMESKYAHAAGFTKLKDLADAISKYHEAIIEYVREMLPIWDGEQPRSPIREMQRGVCVYHLSMMILAAGKEEKFYSVLASLGMPRHARIREQIDIARRIVKKYDR